MLHIFQRVLLAVTEFLVQLISLRSEERPLAHSILTCSESIALQRYYNVLYSAIFVQN